MGWIGLAIIALTNVYVIRKRAVRLQAAGNIQHWLKWHIVFGLWGPILVLFHANFKAGGLVALSIWSMVIVVVSGIVGYFLYIQVLDKDAVLIEKIASYENMFDKLAAADPRKGSGQSAMEKAKARALARAGYHALATTAPRSSVGLLAESLYRDVGLWCFTKASLWQRDSQIQKRLYEWAQLKRRQDLTSLYKNAMGYWHAFHAPFTQLMYLIILIHIVSSLIFSVH